MANRTDNSQGVLPFYNSLARLYHLIFEDWDKAIARQASVLDELLKRQFPQSCPRVLDCACGIGTQSIGLAEKGYDVVASDLSPAAVTRAKFEAESRGLRISFYVADMTNLAEIPSDGFDVVAAFDNVLPHLTSERLIRAATAMKAKLRPGGLFVASLRDYDAIIDERPKVQQPSFYGEEGERRIVHQIWDWKTNETYTVHLYLTIQKAGEWECHHFATDYRCLLRGELNAILGAAGFDEIQWISSPDSGYYQPIVMAKAAA